MKSIGLTGLVFKIVAGVGVVVAGSVMLANMVTTVDANEIVIKQNCLDGKLQVWNEPGVHWQNFGTITRYKRSAQFWFSKKTDEGKETDESILIRYADGAHSNISGSLRYMLPTDSDKMIALHKTYHSMAALDHELVRQLVAKAVFMSGPLMTSRESYAERRNDLINYISSQVEYGVFRTEHEQVESTDPITGQKKTVDLVRPKANVESPEGIEREEVSPMQMFGMNAANITISAIDYDPAVEAQIKQQQEAYMAVQQSMVLSKKAEQDAMTIELQGKASAAKAKWEQEVIAATATTKAQQEKTVAITAASQNKEVAELSLQTAKLAAQETMTKATADAKARQLSITADNALQARLDAYVEISKAQADAMGKQRQTPDVVLGGSGSTGSASALMEMLTAKTARDLNVSQKP